MPRIPDHELDDLRARNPVDAYASRFVALRRQGRKMVGPCPICSINSQSRTAGRFECDGEEWVCAVCCDGGDVIKLVERVENLAFREAVERLGGTRAMDEGDAKRLADERAAKRAKAERDAAAFRERERAWCHDTWSRGIAWPDTPVEDYLTRRGVVLPKAPGRGPLIRFAPELPYFVPGAERARRIHAGPAMLAAITGRDGRFAGLHMTWLDLGRPKGKAEIVDPDTGEVMPAKKVRGSKKGGRIELVRHPAPAALYAGEGIETVGAVFTAMEATGRDLAQAAFWTSVDLGNLGGKAVETMAHPTLRNAAGRPQRVPGPQPDLTEPAMAVPESVTAITYLADGDSDRVLTENTIRRAALRNHRPGLVQRVAWPGDGVDFGDLAMEEPKEST